MPRNNSPVIAALTLADAKLLSRTARHCRTILAALKSHDLAHKNTVVCEAVRLLRRKDLPALQRRLEIWNIPVEKSSTGSPESPLTSPA